MPQGNNNSLPTIDKDQYVVNFVDTKQVNPVGDTQVYSVDTKGYRLSPGDVTIVPRAPGILYDPNKVIPIDSQGTGMKYDGGKQLGALAYQDFVKAIKAVNAIGTFGAKKYKRSSWKTVPDAIQRYEDAAHRHLLDYNDGQVFDPESGYHHLAHYAWNVLAVLSLRLETELLHRNDNSTIDNSAYDNTTTGILKI